MTSGVAAAKKTKTSVRPSSATNPPANTSPSRCRSAMPTPGRCRTGLSRPRVRSRACSRRRTTPPTSTCGRRSAVSRLRGATIAPVAPIRLVASATSRASRRSSRPKRSIRCSTTPTPPAATSRSPSLASQVVSPSAPIPPMARARGRTVPTVARARATPPVARLDPVPPAARPVSASPAAPVAATCPPRLRSVSPSLRCSFWPCATARGPWQPSSSSCSASVRSSTSTVCARRAISRRSCPASWRVWPRRSRSITTASARCRW